MGETVWAWIILIGGLAFLLVGLLWAVVKGWRDDRSGD